MKCHYCGKEVWLVRHLLDGDFCSPVHRKKYHERLRRSLEQLPEKQGPPAPPAGFRFEMPPMDSHGTGRRRSLGFLSSRFGAFPPFYALELTPLFGQAFFGPTAVTAAKPKACVHSPTMLEPLTRGPNLTRLGRCWTLAGDATMAGRDRLLPVGAVHVDAGPPALPLCSPPVALVARAPQVVGPRLALGGVFGAGLTGETLSSLPNAQLGDLRHVPLASWTRANLEPILMAGRPAGAAEALPRAVAAITTRTGSCLGLTQCAPANFPAPLLAEGTVASGKMSSADIQTAPIERRAEARLPVFQAAATARLAPDVKGIWKINAATPWNVAQQAVAEAIAAAPSSTVLPAMALAPVRPDLVAECEIRLAAQALDVPALALHQAGTTIDAVAHPAVLPAMALAPVRPDLVAECEIRLAAQALDMPALALHQAGTAIDAMAHSAVLPAMALAPVRPDLVTECEIRLAAQALDMPALALHQAGTAIDAVAHPAVLPAMALAPVRPDLVTECEIRLAAQALDVPALALHQAGTAIDAVTHPAVLPAMAVAPVRPGLAAESQIRPVAAHALEMPALASHQEGTAIDAVERPAVPPSIAVPAFAPALPGAFAPHLYQSNVVSAQEYAAVPAPAGEMPLAGAFSASDPLLERSLAPCLETGAGATSELRPGAAQPMGHAIPAFVPQAAVPRYAGELKAAQRLANAIPAGTGSGFTWSPFAGVGPQPVERRLQPLVPEAAPVGGVRISLREPEIAITGIGVPERMGVVPLDVYVQRVRSAPKRECAWRELHIHVVQPTAVPDVWPARFEQLVLQDWRRRYPARQLSMAPAPIAAGAKVLPIARQLPALARLRQLAPHLVKGVAAAVVVGAVLWLSWSTETVKNAVTADRHWLRDTIAKRATLVHADNFHAGLNLWEGRKNWASTWSHSADGFMRAGQLALYRPTITMDNYRLEFFTQIESKSVGWVFRAKDEQNYYAMKLSVTEPGPRPLVSVVRYPVLEGRKGKRVQIPLSIMMHNNTPYHVALDVKGTRFRTFVEDQEVDSWTDDRLRSGGVGFFSEAGEHARLYWVKVSNNTDWLGRLCGILAGSGNAQDSADLWNPAEPGDTLARLDPGNILNGAKNVDIKRGAPTPVRYGIFVNSL